MVKSGKTVKSRSCYVTLFSRVIYPLRQFSFLRDGEIALQWSVTGLEP